MTALSLGTKRSPGFDSYNFLIRYFNYVSYSLQQEKNQSKVLKCMNDLIAFFSLYLYRYIYHKYWYGTKNIGFPLKLLTIMKYPYLHVFQQRMQNEATCDRSKLKGGKVTPLLNPHGLQQMPSPVSAIRKHLIICSCFVCHVQHNQENYFSSNINL